MTSLCWTMCGVAEWPRLCAVSVWIVMVSDRAFVTLFADVMTGTSVVSIMTVATALLNCETITVDSEVAIRPVIS